MACLDYEPYCRNWVLYICYLPSMLICCTIEKRFLLIGRYFSISTTFVHVLWSRAIHIYNICRVFIDDKVQIPNATIILKATWNHRRPMICYVFFLFFDVQATHTWSPSKAQFSFQSRTNIFFLDRYYRTWKVLLQTARSLDNLLRFLPGLFSTCVSYVLHSIDCWIEINQRKIESVK